MRVLNGVRRHFTNIFFCSCCFEDDEKIGIEQVKKLVERQVFILMELCGIDKLILVFENQLMWNKMKIFAKDLLVSEGCCAKFVEINGNDWVCRNFYEIFKDAY